MRPPLCDRLGPHHLSTSPQVAFTIVPVMPAARSDARNTATSAMSTSLGARRSAAIPAIISTTARGSGAFAPPDLGEFLLGRRLGDTRGPDAADSDAARSHLSRQVPHERLRPCVGWSGAAHTRHRPGPDALFRCKITPKPCSIMWRPAARAVRKLLHRPLTTARKRSSAVPSVS